VRKRMERKGEKGSEEDDYFNKFPPTMPSVFTIMSYASVVTFHADSLKNE
jgi:hypothetical protein